MLASVSASGGIALGSAATLAPASRLAEPSELTVAEHRALPEDERPWQTVVWDDPVNLMSYVSYVFQVHFGYDRAHAQRLMLRVHHEGSAVVAEGEREAMELHVEAMHGYGLWATVRQAGAA